jgi:hypothetical protein
VVVMMWWWWTGYCNNNINWYAFLLLHYLTEGILKFVMKE